LAAALTTLTEAVLVNRQPTKAAKVFLHTAVNDSSIAAVTEQMLQGAFSGFYELREAATPVASLSAGGEDAHKEDQAPPQGINLQVPEKELKELLAQLSAKCEKQFSAIIHGQGPGMHMYGAPAGGHGKSLTCAELEGASCAMDAHVTQEKTVSGRSMSSTTAVSGRGCLPESCHSGKDLEVLANFMQHKAQEAIPGMGVSVHLSVDCSKTKGSVVEVGASEAASKKPPRAGKMPKGAAERMMLPNMIAFVAVLSATLGRAA